MEKLNIKDIAFCVCSLSIYQRASCSVIMKLEIVRYPYNTILFDWLHFRYFSLIAHIQFYLNRIYDEPF